MEEKKVLELNLNDVLPNRFQPRRRFNEEAINELAESIKEHGVIQPIVVRTLGDKYEIIAGERRYKASLLAGKATIPAIVADLDDRDSAEVALIENIQRQDLTPIEEATSYKKILDMKYLTQSELAQKLGKEQSTISNKLRLLNLHEDVQDALLDEEISERHARSLLRLDLESQKDLLKRIIDERLTVRKTDQEIDNILNGGSVKPVEVIDFTKESEAKSMPEILDFNETSVVEEVNPVSEVVESSPIIEPSSNVFDFNFDEVKQSPEEVSVQETQNEVVEPVVEEVAPTNTFVDVEKIEKEAQDIFVEKPATDLATLLNEPEQVVDLTPRKFFTFIPEEVSEETTKETEEVFNKFSFEEEKPAIEPTVETPIVEAPSIEPVSEEPFKFEFNETPVVEESVVEPTIEEPMIKPVIEEPFKFNFDNMSEINEEAPKPVPIIANVDDLLEDTPVITEPSDIVVAKDMKSVINIVRQCTSSIEKLGYVVDTDEFDFDDMYQVIIKINKE